MKLHLHRFNLSIYILLVLIGQLSAQTMEVEDSTKNHFTVSGYSEMYYGLDGRDSEQLRPEFLYNFNRNKQFKMNLTYIKASINKKYFRSNLALGAGTYMQANYASERGLFKHIFEGNIGIRLSKKTNVWLDAGVMPSHIGFESAIGKDNWNLTRSILAENSPYFENGIKISYTTPSGNLMLSGLVLQGWQRIRRLKGNSTPSFGTQLLYKPNEHLTFNYSTFLGSDRPDSTYRFRHFHNIYGFFMFNERLGLITGMDIGVEKSDVWYSVAGILRYTPSQNWAIAMRGELYQDKKGVIITNYSTGFDQRSISLNIDYSPVKQLLCRVEGRWFKDFALYTFSTSFWFL